MNTPSACGGDFYSSANSHGSLSNVAGDYGNEKTYWPLGNTSTRVNRISINGINELPKQVAVYDQILSLPIYPKMTEADVRDVINSITKIVRQYQR